MNDKVQIIIELHKSEAEESKHNLKDVFEQVLEIFVLNNYDDEYESLYCSIHNSFSKGHNCVGCNLNDDNIRLESFLVNYEHFYDANLTFTTFILLLYLQVESIHEYFQIIQLQESYRLKHFQVFQEIKRWANFLKHPKSFMLVHHPIYSYEGRKVLNPKNGEFIIEKCKKSNPLIDSSFVNTYYSGDKKNKELYKKLHKKEDLIVLFPDPIRLIKEFTEAQNKFTDMIFNNEIVRDLLDNETTIEDYFIEDEHENE